MPDCLPAATARAAVTAVTNIDATRTAGAAVTAVTTTDSAGSPSTAIAAVTENPCIPAVSTITAGDTGIVTVPAVATGTAVTASTRGAGSAATTGGGPRPTSPASAGYAPVTAIPTTAAVMNIRCAISTMSPVAGIPGSTTGAALSTIALGAGDTDAHRPTPATTGTADPARRTSTAVTARPTGHSRRGRIRTVTTATTVPTDPTRAADTTSTAVPDTGSA